MQNFFYLLIRSVTRLAIVVAFAAWSHLRATAAEPPATLPRYEVDITFETAPARAIVRERVTWTNTAQAPTAELAFNFYPHYAVPPGEALLFAKTLELLRLQPSLGIDHTGKHGHILSAHLLAPDAAPQLLTWSYDENNPTALRFTLPRFVKHNESVTVELLCEIRLPNKQGRWGHYEGVTFLTNALPLLAVYSNEGWKPMPFVPWHQPWYNEAGVFRTTITVPQNEVVACSAPIKSETKIERNRKKIECEEIVGRDFAVLTSSRYREYTGTTKLASGRTIALKCLAFAEHEHYAKEILKIVGDAIPIYSQWFGDYPYEQFTVAESYFGWNGNECAGLIMVDERVFGMPHLANGYVEYLVSHETCHQWWYNLIGTNGYAEPYLDEGAAAFFTHRMLDQKRGKNNAFLTWPKGLSWLPNINRENYRYGSMYHAIRNNEMTPAAQELPQYKHLFGLFTGAYDRGSKVFAMIESRLGEAAFLDFIRGLVNKYSWGMLTSALLRAELEAYTGRDWGDFFEKWVFGTGLTDWGIERAKAEMVRANGPRLTTLQKRFPILLTADSASDYRWRVSVVVKQSRELTEPTVLAITSGKAVIRLPIGPFKDVVKLEQHNATITPLSDNRWRVELELPFEPEQITVDPDGVLLDANPGNNHWKPQLNTRLTPLYTLLEETNLTTNYDRWNLVAGPWMWGPAAQDPWYTRSTMLGFRAGGFRTERASLGAYTAIRSDYRDAVVGADMRLMFPHREVGANVETRIAGPVGGLDGAGGPYRASVYARNIRRSSSSMYLPPMLYDEGFVTYQDNFLPFARARDGSRWDRMWMAGWHVRLNLNTPYWDPECGVWFDAMAAGGQAEFSGWKPMAQGRVELAAVHSLPEFLGPLQHVRLAARVVGQVATPNEGQFFALGGGTLFRGFDLAERQGSALWVANAEVRLPLARNVTWDALDHVFGVRNAWLATFYDVGAVYANRQLVRGNVAHAVGLGLRVDVAVFSFIERATLRFDVGKSLNGGTPLQFWFGMQHPF